MSKMFPGVKTWSPATGCTHECPYCSAEKRALPRVRGKPKYESGWKPTVHFDVLSKGPPKCDTCFVTYMGDLFCDGFTLKEIDAVLTVCMFTPSSKVKNFLLMTKNPRRYLDLLEKCPDVVPDGRFIFGSTIETDQDNLRFLAPKAPRPSSRLKALIHLRDTYPLARIAVSMEPVMDFNPERMGPLLVDIIKPEIVWIGYDGYNYISGDDEPTKDKVIKFIEYLRRMNINVVEKLIRDSRVTP